MNSDGILTESGDLEALRRLQTMEGQTKHHTELENLTTVDFRLDFEKNFNDDVWFAFMKNYWWLSLVASAIYVVTIFTIQHVMKSRERFVLRGPLIVWNVFLAVFSIMGAYRSCFSMYLSLSRGGWMYSVCDSNGYTHHFITGFWAFAFVVSKVVEFGDTLFIVLRKGKLIFLHWYHHITVLSYVSYSYSEQSSTGYWFMVLNFVVHSFMYSYYAVRASGYIPPKFIAMSITVMQVTQMIAGCYIQVYVFLTLRQGISCNVNSKNNLWGSLMYFSYLVLFSHFFYNAYLKKPSKQQIKKD